MAVFRGFSCDACGLPKPNSEKIRRVVRYEGEVMSGEYEEEFCTDCVVVPEGVTLRPLRRRRRQTQQQAVPPTSESP